MWKQVSGKQGWQLHRMSSYRQLHLRLLQREQVFVRNRKLVILEIIVLCALIVTRRFRNKYEKKNENQECE